MSHETLSHFENKAYPFFTLLLLYYFSSETFGTKITVWY